MHACKYISMQVKSIQVCKDASMQRCKDASIQQCQYNIGKDVIVQLCLYARWQVVNYASMHINMQVFK